MSNINPKQITHRSLRQRLEKRFVQLIENGPADGGSRYSDEADFLETVLADEIEESETPQEKKERLAVEAALKRHAQRIRAAGNTDGGGTCRPDGGSSPLIPDHVLGDAPSSPHAPLRHGGYDGQTAVGFEGNWDTNQFDKLLTQLDAAKNQACEASKAIVTSLAGQDVMIEPTGTKGALYYKYRLQWDGVTLYIHHKPESKRIQPVRVVYGAEVLMTNSLFAVHSHVLEFLSSLGFQKTGEKISRLDAQVMLDVPISTFVCLILEQYLITKFRSDRSYDLLRGKPNDMTFGTKEKVEIAFYDKRKEMSKSRDFAKEHLFAEHCVGWDWYSDVNRPITRVEIRLGRDALRPLGINSIDDLRQREKALYDLITREWFRILASPKVRGTENQAALHDVWKRVRTLFREYFAGNDVKDVEWKKPAVGSCDPLAAEQQAAGNLAAAVANRLGEQANRKEVIKYIEDFGQRFVHRLLEKALCIVEGVKIRQGIMLGIDDRFPIGEGLGYLAWQRMCDRPELRLRR